jgi:hypothetical protein
MVGGIIPLRRATSSRYDGRLEQESAAGFIDEDQSLQIKPWLLLLQGFTSGGDVRPVLLGGPQTFF